jgi:hypothetical protein
MEPTLNLVGLSGLLENNYFDPVLWQLYSTCKYFHHKKPRDLGTREIRIRNYASCNIVALSEGKEKSVEIVKTLQWLKGDLAGVRDLLIYDKAKPHYALIGLDQPKPNEDARNAKLFVGDEHDDDDAHALRKTVKVFYVIPAEWLHYVYVRFENNSWTMYLAAKKFCCRQILVRGTVTIARRENISINAAYAQIDNRYVPCPNYFHVGVGECGKDVHNILADVGIFVNGKQLYDSVSLIAGPYGQERGVIFALSQHDDKLQFSDGYVTSKYLKHIMKHLLVCRSCNMYVDKLVEMICSSLVKDSTVLSNMETTNCTADIILPGGVPCYTYILDGDFNTMRKDAYKAPLKTLFQEQRKNSINICKDIIDPFFEKHGLYYYINMVNIL